MLSSPWCWKSINFFITITSFRKLGNPIHAVGFKDLAGFPLKFTVLKLHSLSKNKSSTMFTRTVQLYRDSFWTETKQQHLHKQLLQGSMFWNFIHKLFSFQLFFILQDLKRWQLKMLLENVRKQNIEVGDNFCLDLKQFHILQRQIHHYRRKQTSEIFNSSRWQWSLILHYKETDPLTF